jgi:hypothetical protein
MSGKDFGKRLVALDCPGSKQVKRALGPRFFGPQKWVEVV